VTRKQSSLKNIKIELPDNLKFGCMSRTLADDSDKLEETYNVQKLVHHFQRVCNQYDLSTPFESVLCFDPSTATLDESKTMNLFTQYNKMTPEFVASSNLFYTSYLVDNGQILEDSRKGGPLLFPPDDQATIERK